MPHQLLISVILRTPEQAFAPYLTTGEVVRGFPFSAFISIDNTGDDFPGSRAISLRFEVGQFDLRLEEEREIPPLPATGGSVTLEFHDLILMAEGLGWLDFRATAVDGEQILYQQARDSPAVAELGIPIFVVNRELLHLVWVSERGG